MAGRINGIDFFRIIFGVGSNVKGVCLEPKIFSQKYEKKSIA